MSDSPEIYNSETRDVLRIVEHAIDKARNDGAREVEIVLQKAGTSTRPEVSIEVRIKR